jgi:hypothetical protein
MTRNRTHEVLKRLAATVILAFLAGPVMADVYVHLDYSNLYFHYDKTAAGPFMPNQVIGTITVSSTGSSSHAIAEVMDSGPDGWVGTGDDILIDRIDNVSPFYVQLTADVIYLGPNSYQVVTNGGQMLYGTDGSSLTSGNSFEASFASHWLNIAATVGNPPVGGAFTMTGALSTRSGNDAILLDNDTPDGPAWVYYKDGNGGTPTDSISLYGGGPQIRTNYDVGSLVELQAQFDPNVRGLDDFFGASRDATYVKMDLYIIPAPGAAVLGVLGLGLVGTGMRKRMA